MKAIIPKFNIAFGDKRQTLRRDIDDFVFVIPVQLYWNIKIQCCAFTIFKISEFRGFTRDRVNSGRDLNKSGSTKFVQNLI